VQFRRRLSALLLSAALAAGLSGCVAIPPAVTLASLGIDLGSFALTGKTASDHVLSAVAGEDCRLAGVLEGEICREEREFEEALAVLEPLPEGTQVASAGGETDNPRVQLAAETSASEAPAGFTVPSGTVVSEEPEHPVGGFAFGGGKVRALPKPQAAPSGISEASDAETAGDVPALADFLSDDALPRAPSPRRQLAEHFEAADFLSQASPDVGASS
jgi:hypothetical protein